VMAGLGWAVLGSAVGYFVSSHIGMVGLSLRAVGWYGVWDTFYLTPPWTELGHGRSRGVGNSVVIACHNQG
jgi:hypothetical protein